MGRIKLIWSARVVNRTRKSTWPTLLLAALLSSACALSPTRGPDTIAPTKHGYDLNHPLADYYDTAFVLRDSATSAPYVITAAQLADRLSKYDVVFYGESHGHPGVHLQEMLMLRALYDRNPLLILSLEQFERDVQNVVDEYLNGRIGESALIERGRAWNNYAASYRPLLTFAKEHRLPVVAAEAPDWTITCVGHAGLAILDQFTPTERGWVAADVHTGPGRYRDEYDKFLGGSATHGGGKPATPDAQAAAQRDADRSFAAQATRDDTMAESVARALERHPGYKVLHITGSFHSSNFLGTVERLRLRAPNLKIAVIDPVEVEHAATPQFTADDLDGATAIQLIYPNPPLFVEGEDTNEWLGRMSAKRKAACKYSLPEATPAAPGASGGPGAPGAQSQPTH